MPPWLTRAVAGIVLATFFSDVGHEMVTAVLPLYLGSIGLGAAALGVFEGVADLLFSLAKLGGGVLGHHLEKKKPVTVLGYLLTALGSAAMALVTAPLALGALRGVAWLGRGVRSPLRDFLLADEVGQENFGRAYGVERAADMLGAVAGPLVAIALVSAGAKLETIILVSVGPAMISVLAIGALVRDKRAPPDPSAAAAKRAPLPRGYWMLLVGVLLFGLGDFSRTFLVLLAASAFGAREAGVTAGASLSIPILLYALHNLVSAVVAYPAGWLGDKRPKRSVLVGGYVVGVATNVLLAVGSGSKVLLVVAIVLSGATIAVEETIEKAAVAALLDREQRALGLGVLASANAVGDMVSSVAVGFLLHTGHTTLAFAIPAAFGAAGVAWLLSLPKVTSPST